ncbi:hypothetical protein GCM10023329_26760 [Streptomyces sanyensis]|uniref:Histidine kinase/HSP90-like ATPase domain-containing protein n=1 Tax=Streptomyces sanyensis TaxID=568869 RepID=A0ABP9A9Z5_9ACTN
MARTNTTADTGGTPRAADGADGADAGEAPDAVARVPQGPGEERSPYVCLRAQFGATPRGARLARRVAVRHLGEWGHPPASELACAAALVVAELAGNAVRHGRVRGRDFGLRLELREADGGGRGVLRVEVADAAEARPSTSVRVPCADEESGRGLVLVDALAERWGVERRVPVGKTVWAELEYGARG